MAKDSKDDYIKYYGDLANSLPLDYMRDHVVVDSQGKIIGYTYKEQLLDWNKPTTQIGWYEKGTNVCYKQKTKKGKYVDPIGTTANFWQIIVDKINADFEVSVDDVKVMFGEKYVSDKLFDTVKKFNDKFIGGAFGKYTGDILEMTKNLVGGAGDGIVAVLKAGVKAYNKRNPKKQIIWDGDHIKIGDVFIAIVSYLYITRDIILLWLILNLIKVADKQHKENKAIAKMRSDLNDKINADIIRRQKKELMIEWDMKKEGATDDDINDQRISMLDKQKDYQKRMEEKEREREARFLMSDKTRKQITEMDAQVRDLRKQQRDARDKIKEMRAKVRAVRGSAELELDLVSGLSEEQRKAIRKTFPKQQAAVMKQIADQDHDEQSQLQLQIDMIIYREKKQLGLI